MVIEDAPWADDATVDLLTYLGRRVATTRAVIVVSFRDDLDPTHPLRVALGDIAPGLRTRIELEPLSVAAVRRLASWTDIDADSLHRLTGGNPFFVTETLAGDPAILPPTVREAVLARVARLTLPARRAIEAADLARRHRDDDARRGRRRRRGRDRRDHRGGMVVAIRSRLEFRHELARLVVVDAIPAARKRELHRLALRAIVSHPNGGVDAARGAHHAEEAGDVDAVLSLAPVAAARATTMGAHREAAAHLLLALGHAERLAPGERADLHARLAWERFVLGELEDSVLSYRAALALARTVGDPLVEGHILTEGTGALAGSGRQQESIDWAREAVVVLEEASPGGPGLAHAYGALSAQHMLAREFDQAEHWAGRAIALATELGRDDHLSYVLIQSGVALFISGDDAGLARIHRGMELARRDPARQHRVGLGYAQIGSGGGEIRRYDVAVPAIQACIDWSRRWPGPTATTSTNSGPRSMGSPRSAPSLRLAWSWAG